MMIIPSHYNEIQYWQSLEIIFMDTLLTQQDLGLKCSAWEVFGYK